MNRVKSIVVLRFYQLIFALRFYHDQRFATFTFKPIFKRILRIHIRITFIAGPIKMALSNPWVDLIPQMFHPLWTISRHPMASPISIVQSATSRASAIPRAPWTISTNHTNKQLRIRSWWYYQKKISYFSSWLIINSAPVGIWWSYHCFFDAQPKSYMRYDLRYRGLQYYDIGRIIMKMADGYQMDTDPDHRSPQDVIWASCPSSTHRRCEHIISTIGPKILEFRRLIIESST